MGRTARADTTGVAITLINQDDMHDFSKIEELIDTQIHKLDIPKEMGQSPEWDPKFRPKQRGGSGRGRHGGGRGRGGSGGRGRSGGGGNRRGKGGNNRGKSRGGNNKNRGPRGNSGGKPKSDGGGQKKG